MPEPEPSDQPAAPPDRDRAEVIRAIIHDRRTTRRFDPDRCIPNPLLVQLLNLATQAPSGHNLQPWRFVVIRSARNRRHLSRAAYGHRGLAEAPVALVALGSLFPHRSHLEMILSRQEACMGLTSDETAAQRGKIVADRERRNDPVVWALRSTMLAVGTFVLAAEAHGLGTCLIDCFDDDRVRASFAIPDDHTIACLLAVGYAAEAPPDPGRLPLRELLFDEFFGQPSTLCPLEDTPLAPSPPTE